MIKQPIKIDIISDVVCPWCYIGKRRLEKAILELSGNYELELEYHPFELNDSIPREGINRREHLIQKFGSLEHYEHITDRVSQVAAGENLSFNFEMQPTIPNTRKIHALIQFSKTRIKHEELVENFFKAYFTDGIDLSVDENIIAIAAHTGIDSNEATAILSDDRSLRLVAEAEAHVKKLGIHAVPFYIFNSKHGLSGAQPSSVFLKLIEEMASNTTVVR